jgi:hypothetical protein
MICTVHEPHRKSYILIHITKSVAIPMSGAYEFSLKHSFADKDIDE